MKSKAKKQAEKLNVPSTFVVCNTPENLAESFKIIPGSLKNIKVTPKIQ